MRIKDVFWFSGATNDVLFLMERDIFFESVTRFFTANGFERGGMAGGQFHGKMLRRMLEPTMLQKFSSYIGSNGDIFINYLNSIRELYSVIVKKEFDLEDAWEKVEQFKKCFQKVHVYGVSETLKESIQILYPRLHFKWCII